MTQTLCVQYDTLLLGTQITLAASFMFALGVYLGRIWR